MALAMPTFSQDYVIVGGVDEFQNCLSMEPYMKDFMIRKGCAKGFF